MKNLIYLLLLVTISCQQKPKTNISAWVPYGETEELAQNANHPNRKLQYHLIQSRILDKNELWKNVADQLIDFGEEDYQALKPLILEQDIPTIHSAISEGKLSYAQLTQWYLYRIVKFENDKEKALNSIIAINPNALREAKEKDKNKATQKHPICGMPILLKDNINFEGLATTAGAFALLNNYASDAYIVKQLKANGAIILGKANLSEWANFNCLDCPNGFSAVGGQTLNPYGRRNFDTGGSSSGSGASTAANYAVAAIGTETSGSILSPSSKNSVVGLKPTVGLLSRGGIVPISSTLDTPGPMTKNVIDNAILLSALSGEDPMDAATKDNPKNINYWEEIKNASLKGMRFGAYSNLLRDSLYALSIERMKSLGAEIIEIESERVNFDGFGDLLSADMRIDLADYFQKYASKEIGFTSVEDIVRYNYEDSTLRIPYGQGRIEGVLSVDLSKEELDQLSAKLNEAGKSFFDQAMDANQLDAILSINNRNAGFAAAAKYPCLTVPMGYSKEGEPSGLTFIARTFEEEKLLKMAYAFEQGSKCRLMPSDFQ
ncbi:MAG: hypothetical protein JW729_04735 [Bacteroidales bacterium]|nr:hypothetical protein [Bacteroidales bacterium]